MEQKSIGGFIAALRKANGLTQQDLADKLNVSNKTISKWECGDSHPDLTVIPVIAEIFGVSCDELLKGARSKDATGGEMCGSSDKRIKYLVGKMLVKFKAASVVGLALVLLGGLLNYIISYAAFRPDVGFWVMIGVFISAVTVEIVFIISFNGKLKENELLENIPTELKDGIIETIYNYSLAVFYSAVALLIITLPLYILYLKIPYVYAVINFGDYASLVPYCAVVCIAVFMPFKALYAPRVKNNNRSLTILYVAQFVLILIYYVIVFVFAYYILSDFSATITVWFLTVGGLFIASIIIFVVFARKIAFGAVIITSLRNFIFLALPVIENIIYFAFDTQYDRVISSACAYIFVAVITVAHYFIVKHMDNPKNTAVGIIT